MRKFLCALIFLSCLFPASLFADQNNLVRTTLTSPRALETEPGKILTASILVSSNSAFEERFYEELVLPDGWQVITPAGKTFFNLKPKEQQLRIVSFLVPLSSSAANYQAGYYVRSSKDERIFVREDISVKISSLRNLDLSVEERPEIVIAGDAYNVKLRLVNKGNEEIKLKINVKSDPDSPVKVEPPEIILEPNGSQLVQIQVQTNKRTTRSIDNLLTIKAQTQDAKYQVEQALLVKVVSTITGRLDPYFRIPSQIKLIGLSEKLEGQDHTYRFQEEVSGAGSLDEQGKRRVDYLFRAPNLQKIGPYGQVDEYHFSYFDSFVDFHVGDRSYSLSPLTDLYKYGRGSEIDIHTKNLGFGAFYVKDRFNEPKEKHEASYMSYTFKDTYTFRGNFLHKELGSDGPDDRIYSFQTLLKPSNLLNLNLEYARNQSDRGGLAVRDGAYYADITGSYADQFYYNYEDIHADPKFFGYYNDVDSKSGTLNFPVFKKLKGNIYFRNYEDNLKLDPAKSIANREQYYKGGVNYPLNSAINLSLDYEDYRKKDALLPEDFNFAENDFTFGLGWSNLLRKINFQGFFERGVNKNRLLGAKSNIQRERFYVNLNPTQRQSYNIYATIGNDRFTDNPQKSKSIGIQAVWNIMANFNVSLDYEKINFRSGGLEEQNKYTSRMTYVFPSRQELAFGSSWQKLKASKQQELSLSLTYTIPWDIPVGRKHNIGVLKGRVFDAEKQGNPGLSKVILIAGDATAVTNSKGEYVFPALTPGTHSLSINKPSIGLSRIATQKMPLTVGIKGGQTSRMDIGIEKGARIFGKLVAYGFKNEPAAAKQKIAGERPVLLEATNAGAGGPSKEEFVEKAGLANILVEINDGEEILQQRTDNSGEFSFEGVRPGKWMFIVNTEDLPGDLSVEKNEFKVEVKPGEERQIVIKAEPRIMHIQILEKGELKLEKRPGKNPFLEKLRRLQRRFLRKPR